MQAKSQGRVLCIGRSDPVGSGGIQNDIKAITALGGHATSVVTTVTAGSGNGAFDNLELTPTIIVRQLETVLDTVDIDCIKIGQLLSSEQIDLIANSIERLGVNIPMVVAPVLIWLNGEPRLTTRTLATLKRRLLHSSQTVCVSVAEAELLTGFEIHDVDAMMHAAMMILTFGCRTVLVHGANFSASSMTDILASEEDIEILNDTPKEFSTLPGGATTLAASIATEISLGWDPVESIRRARRFVYLGAQQALNLGNGQKNWPVLNYTALARNHMTSIETEFV